ncbi:MAG: 2-phospho-L-lactate transferase [Pelolinea sp.]|nr:2-phospho-L-lactate transferase [Pelolinea sp.]
MKITALAGGVGGAKLAHGFSKLLDSNEFNVIVNTGDDFEHFGLYISPDMDTVCYTLAELSNSKTGWGRENESFNVLETIKELGGPEWFILGDKDIAYHLERTRKIKMGYSLTRTSLELERALGLKHKIFPMCDEKVSTFVDTVELGEIPFQEYFVKHKCQPIVSGFRFNGIGSARITEEAKNSLEQADIVVICPSNPFVSISPIISLEGVREILKQKYVIAVSPIIGGAAVKGPLAKMLNELGWDIHPRSILRMYQDFLNCFYIAPEDFDEDIKNNASGIIVKEENIFLPNINSRKKLAFNIINHMKEIQH